MLEKSFSLKDSWMLQVDFIFKLGKELFSSVTMIYNIKIRKSWDLILVERTFLISTWIKIGYVTLRCKAWENRVHDENMLTCKGVCYNIFCKHSLIHLPLSLTPYKTTTVNGTNSIQRKCVAFSSYRYLTLSSPNWNIKYKGDAKIFRRTQISTTTYFNCIWIEPEYSICVHFRAYITNFAARHYTKFAKVLKSQQNPNYCTYM